MDEVIEVAGNHFADEQNREATIRAPCKDCGRDTEPMGEGGQPVFAEWDFYMVHPAVWKAAGMAGYASGFLCTLCLSKRLGRELTEADYLSEPMKVGPDGQASFKTTRHGAACVVALNEAYRERCARSQERADRRAAKKRSRRSRARN